MGEHEWLRANRAWMDRAFKAEGERDALVSALKDIAYVAENGRPVEGKDPAAVQRWCQERAKEALDRVGVGGSR